MKRVLILLVAVVLLASCATVEQLNDGWDRMSPEQAAFEKTLLIVSGALFTAYTGYTVYVAATTTPFDENLLRQIESR